MSAANGPSRTRRPKRWTLKKPFEMSKDELKFRKKLQEFRLEEAKKVFDVGTLITHGEGAFMPDEVIAQIMLYAYNGKIKHTKDLRRNVQWHPSYLKLHGKRLVQIVLAATTLTTPAPATGAPSST
ncbi:hypothetical protein BDN72DRAFT_851167 [Pluteus cervinus]|uniref:Uncharacterized protein n=1 Tax=Pluteus cervinus TaxID=181527 RepID=A0ACD3A2J5_9AGAR|nr:hypothetical protein BDN72DRAFT_851167 [Pluteus cervinus]